MPELIAFPITLSSDGSFVTVEDGPDYYAQELAMLIQTDPGERVLVPEYGMSDPSFTELDQVELIAQTQTYGPPVTVAVYKTDINKTGDVVRYQIDYEPIEEEDFDEIFEEDDDDEGDYDESEYEEATD